MKSTLLLAAIMLLPAMSEAKADKKLIRKINPYIKCVNVASRNVFSAMGRYRAWYEGRKNRPCPKALVFGLHRPIDQLRVAKPYVMEAKKVRYRAKKLDRAGAAYLKGLEALKAATAKITTYYRKLHYRKDQCAQTETLHKGVMAAYLKFVVADRAVRAELDQAQLGLSQRNLKRIKRKLGKGMTYHRAAAMLAAKRLLLAFKRTAAAKKADGRPVGKLVKAVKGLAAKVAKIDKTNKHSDPCGFRRFARAYQRFSEQAERQAGTMNGKVFIQEYNRLVSRSNTVRLGGRVCK